MGGWSSSSRPHPAHAVQRWGQAASLPLPAGAVGAGAFRGLQIVCLHPMIRERQGLPVSSPRAQINVP